MSHQVAFLQALHHQLGTPYQWGGDEPGGFDCSGLVFWAAKMAGIKGVPRTSQAQYNAGRPVPIGQLRPGDLVFTEPGPSGPGHVGIYVGNGKVESSPHTGAQVHITTLTGFGTLVGARRIMANPQTGHVVNASHYPTPAGQMPSAGLNLPHVAPQFGAQAAPGARQALGAVLPPVGGAQQPQAPSVNPQVPAIPTPSSAPLTTINQNLLAATT